MKKYIGLIILVISILISGVLIKSRSVAVPEEKNNRGAICENHDDHTSNCKSIYQLSGHRST